MLKEKTILTEDLRNHLKKEIKKYESLIKKHSNVKGRGHREIWHYYMGKLCAYQQLFDCLEENNE